MKSHAFSYKTIRRSVAAMLLLGVLFSETHAAEKPADAMVLFDGKSLDGWKKSAFSTEGNVDLKNPFKDGKGAIVIGSTDALNGITFTKDVPKTNYEAVVEALKIDGSDFFCALTFPVGDSAVTFVVGGWGGGVVGISSIDGQDASENETTKTIGIKNDKWYRIRVRVTPEKIEAWIDDEKYVDLKTEGHKLALRHGEIDESLPFGIATYQTTSAIRDVRITKLAAEKK
jgi:hypothetical protein